MVGDIPLKSRKEIEFMRQAGSVTAKILDEVGSYVTPGVSTQELDEFIHRRTMELGAKPATLNYKGYPKSCCISPNEVVCHGIPSPYQQLKSGDIVNVDVTSIVHGYHGDSSRMFFVGGEEACSKEAVDLVLNTRKALYAGISAVKPGGKIGDIGASISDFIRSLEKGYGIVREYTGHGLGRKFHEDPQVLHVARRGTGEVMKPGMTFTIEPMINEGTARTVVSTVDGWTVRTADGKLSAQWEHTILVTESGYEILTKSETDPQFK